MRTRKGNLFITLIILSFYIISSTSCLKEDPVNNKFSSFKPIKTSDGWDISSPSSEHIDSAILNCIVEDLYNDSNAWTLRSFLVIRNGKIVAETYFKSKQDRETQRAIWSCTKQVTSLLVGHAIDSGYIKSLNDPISDYLPEIENYKDKAGIKIIDLLMMKSGINYDNGFESDVLRNRKVNSIANYVLGKKLKWQPGTHFQYNDGAPLLLSCIMQNATGMTLAEYAEKHLFSKINLNNYYWYNYIDGVTLGAFGLIMPPRELAKIAQCVCDGGFSDGTQIIPSSWIDEISQTKTESVIDDLGFSYLWWTYPKYNCLFMWGHGGQFAIIYPEKNLIVIFTGLEQADDNIAFWYKKALYYSKRIADISL